MTSLVNRLIFNSVGIGSTPSNINYVAGNLDVSSNATIGGNVGIGTGYKQYSSFNSRVLAPAATGTINGVNITALNNRMRASYATAVNCISTWTNRNVGSNTWYSICWAAELGIFCAIAPSSSNLIMTSPDGINWTTRASVDETADWTGVCWAAELGLFVAVSPFGTYRIMTSPDGVTWTARSVPLVQRWHSVCWSPQVGRFVVTADNNSQNVLISSDGINWTSVSTGTVFANAQWITGICWAAELGLFVVVGNNYIQNGPRIMTSPDGINWTPQYLNYMNQYTSVCWSPELGLLVAVAGSHNIDGSANRIATSPDGINWTLRSSPLTGGVDDPWSSVCWSAELSLFVAVSQTQRIMYSFDGVTWNVKTVPEGNAWRSICWSPELSIFCAVAVTGTNRVMTSNIALPNSKNVLKFLPNQVSIDASGNIGINTSIPQAKLDVSGAILVALGTVSAPSVAFKGSSSTGIYQPANNQFAIATNGIERLKITESGVLSINGSNLATVATSGSYYDLLNTPTISSSQWTTTGSNIYYTTGNVGIGLTNPTQKLDVSGNVNMNGKLNINSSSNLIFPSNVQLQTNGYDYAIFDMTGLNTLNMSPGILANNVIHSNNEPSILIPRKYTYNPTNQYISIANGSPAAINNIFVNDMTIEAFIYVLEQPGYNGEYSALVGYMSPTGNAGVWSFGVWQNVICFTYNSNIGFNRLNCQTTINTNTWYHIAVVYTKTSNSFSMYVNGTIQAMNAPIGIGGGSTAGATSHTVQGTSLQTQTNDLIIGQYQGQSIYCYVSNLRIVSGSGGNIVPAASPTAPLLVVANTKLLLRCSVTSSVLANFTNNRIAFNTINPIAPFQIADNLASAVGTSVPTLGYRGNANGLMVISSCGVEYSDATNTTTISVYLPGALSASNFSPGGNAFSINVGNASSVLNNNVYYNQVRFSQNFTIDAFVYYTATPINANNNVPYLVCIGDWGGGAFRWGFGMNNNSKLAFAFKNTSSAITVIETSNTMSLNTWHHIAVTHTAATNTLILYLNGTAQALTAGGSSYSTASASMNEIGYPIIIGCHNGQYNRVYFSDLRIITNVTTPAALPLPPQNAISGTTLLLRARATADGNNLVTVLKNGNVGIGTSVPSQLLDVSGNVSFASIAVGSSSLVGGGVQITTENDGDRGDKGRVLRVCANTNSIASNQAVLGVNCATAAAISWRFIQCNSGTTSTGTLSDAEFMVFGNGQIASDAGTTVSSPADYAELFEWMDGNPEAEDRVGYSVSLVGNKIKKADTSDNIIGVISGNPAIIADTAWNRWNNKYLKDDFNRYILEDYEVWEWTDASGNSYKYLKEEVPTGLYVPDDKEIQVLKRYKLNPEYDQNMEYIPREQRKEWSPVGLLGKLRLRKGQPVKSSWIKMRDISNSIEEWLVK
jgi:hypothetical protein